MARMTDEEADALDEFVTNNEITLGPDGSGWLSRREARLVDMDDLSTAWLRGKAEAAHTSVGQIINELVRKELAAQSSIGGGRNADRRTAKKKTAKSQKSNKPPRGIKPHC